MSDTVLLALISLGGATISAITTVITTVVRGRASARHSAKESILQMIMEDHMSVAEGHLPTNYQNVLDEYDIYHKTGGNSYVTAKVEEYKKWFLEQEKANENSNKK